MSLTGEGRSSPKRGRAHRGGGGWSRLVTGARYELPIAGRHAIPWNLGSRPQSPNATTPGRPPRQGDVSCPRSPSTPGRQECPFLQELQGLLVKTAGIVDVLREALAPLSHEIRFAFIHGSFARSEQVSESDVDLMIVGATGLARLSPILRRVERALGRPVNVTVYTPAEFEQKIQSKNHFLLEVLRDKKIVIVGDAAGLLEVAR